jgi:hypothetical protein
LFDNGDTNDGSYVLSRTPLLAAILGFVLLGCQSGDGAGSSAAATPDNVAVDAAGQVGNVPSEHPVGREWRERLGVQLVYDLDARRFAEYQRRIQRCMAERGFDYKPAKFLEAVTISGRLTNPLNEETAKEHGYHIPDVPTAKVPAQDQTPEFALALNGTDEDPAFGCAVPAFLEVQAVVDPAFTQVDLVFGGLSIAVDGFFVSDVGRTALAEWAACMKSHGFPVASPSDMFNRFFKSNPKPTEEEITARLFDLDCDRSSDLTVQRSAWESAAYDRWSSEVALTWQNALKLIDEANRSLADLESATS